MLKRAPLTAILIAGLSLLLTAAFVARAERSHIETVAANQGPATPQNSKANSDPFYQQLRQQANNAEDFAAYVSVNNLALKRDAATFTLKSGELYFSLPIEGRVTAAVFVGAGELTLAPPTEAEKRNLELFTKQTGAMTEEFSTLVLRFTDKTFDEIKNSPNAKMGGSGGAQASRARELFRDNQQLLRRQLHDNRELRTLADLYAPARPGFFNAFINGSRYSKLIFIMDPLGIPEVSPEEIALFSYGESDGGVWAAFHAAPEYEQKTANSAEDHRVY